jgi:predicted O-methyltransferase YrrM
MSATTPNLDTAPGHVVLAAAGKTKLRPGGSRATEQLFDLANFQPGQTVLELASSFGYTAIALAQRYGVRVVGVERNPDSVARARSNIAAAGLDGQVEVIEGNIFRLDEIAEQFDFVLAEAILTMQSPSGKAKVLAEICDRLKPGGTFLSHELLADTRHEEIDRALTQVIRTNAQPLSETGWVEAFSNAGLAIEHCQTGAMGLLDPRQVLRDEGIGGTVKMAWNMVRNPVIRDRIWQMQRVFSRYRQELGYIVAIAHRPT